MKRCSRCAVLKSEKDFHMRLGKRAAACAACIKKARNQKKIGQSPNYQRMWQALALLIECDCHYPEPSFGSRPFRCVHKQRASEILATIKPKGVK